MRVDLSEKKIFKFSSFIELLMNSFNSYFGKDSAVFCAAYPKVSPTATSGDSTFSQLTTPIFTYKYEKTPCIVGSIEKNQEIKPRRRGAEKIKDDEGNDVLVEIYAQRFTYTLTFELWAQNGLEAEQYSEKFQEFMNSYIPYFMDCGCENIIFTKLSADQNEKQWRSDLIRREFSYRLDLDELTNIQRTDIKSILMNLKPTFNYSYQVIDKG